jgi:hypothetical protein
MRIPRSTGALSAVLIVLLGIWGALIPFVGPYFDYSFGVNSTWHYTADRLWLCIVPGAVTVFAGLLLLVASHRAAGILGGWVAVLAGAWFVIAPAVSKTWEHGPGPIGQPLFGPTRQALELIGYFYGLGALIVALGAFAIGRFSSRPAIAAEPATAAKRAVAPAPTIAREPAAAREPAVAAAPKVAREPAAMREPAADPREPAGVAASQSAEAPALASDSPPDTPPRRRSGGLLGRRRFTRGGERQSRFLGH